jgi:hypothetical protein
MCESHQSTVPLNLMPTELARNKTRWPTWLAPELPGGLVALGFVDDLLDAAAGSPGDITKMLWSIPSITSPG